MPLSPGEQLGHYKVVSMLGKGAIGEVYLGTDTRLGWPAAIKVSAREFNQRKKMVAGCDLDLLLY